MRRRVGVVLLGLLVWGIVQVRGRLTPVPASSLTSALKQLPSRESAVAVPEAHAPQSGPAASDAPASQNSKTQDAAYGPIAQAACQSATLVALTESPEQCTQQVTHLRTQIENRIDALAHKGVQLDRESCTATDPNGESTSLDSITEDLVALTRQMVVEKSASALHRASVETQNYAFKRANMVAICSVMKSFDYWARNPEEIPPSDRIEDYLFFDIHEGKPKESFVAGSLLRAISGALADG